MRIEAQGGAGCVVTTRMTGSTDETSAVLLVDRLTEVIRQLVEATSTPHNGVVLSIEDHAGATPGRPIREAFVSACRALVHGFVREENDAIPPVNIVVSDGADGATRDDAIDYLLGPDGGFARGALIDLRPAT